jgi:uncharacterized protein involved in type VI secretion and phage assembly
MEELLARLLEKVENRYYGKYRAFVVDNADPENRGRLRLRIPSVLGNDIVSGWALPCAPYGGAANQGFFFIPEADAGVWVEFEEGNLDYPIWVGTFWSKPGGESEVPKPNDPDGTEQGSVQDPPTRKTIKTLKGHTIQLEDKDGEEMVIILEAENNNVITLDKDGIKIQDKNSNKITLDSSGIKTEDKNGNAITMDSSSVTIKSAQIKIGESASAEKLILGTTLSNLLTSWYTTIATHTHVGNLGAPTSPPTPPLMPPVLTSALSTKHVVE